jgi:hypothetical protein
MKLKVTTPSNIKHTTLVRTGSQESINTLRENEKVDYLAVSFGFNSKAPSYVKAGTRRYTEIFKEKF